ncbi:hypothetical protein EYZ11_010933 [Aspergillus tanneri]|uniref:Uncharacterized protein n=1 Tax=Aspergillus tanneri TaxID=1220188 RepID=A0A4S3J4P8_9EURO|nr:hypothetical protein EYZ11_010933 [Aspergillus tanneri]
MQSWEPSTLAFFYRHGTTKELEASWINLKAMLQPARAGINYQPYLDNYWEVCDWNTLTILLRSVAASEHY